MIIGRIGRGSEKASHDHLMDPSAPHVYTKPLRVAMPIMSPFSSFTSRTSRGTALVKSHCRKVLHPALHHDRIFSRLPILDQLHLCGYTHNLALETSLTYLQLLHGYVGDNTYACTIAMHRCTDKLHATEGTCYTDLHLDLYWMASHIHQRLSFISHTFPGTIRPNTGVTSPCKL